MAIDWMMVKERSGKTPIGAIGFLGDEICVVASLFDDKDWNYDGKIDVKERVFSIFTLKGKALAEVASRAMEEPDILMRDPSLREWQGKLLTKFATGMIVEGAYMSYMAFGISQAAGKLAGAITANAIKAAVIKKGMEIAVKKAFLEAASPR